MEHGPNHGSGRTRGRGRGRSGRGNYGADGIPGQRGGTRSNSARQDGHPTFESDVARRSGRASRRGRGRGRGRGIGEDGPTRDVDAGRDANETANRSPGGWHARRTRNRIDSFGGICRATQTSPRRDLLSDPNEPFAFDVEFQQHSFQGGRIQQRIGRIAIVNTLGEVVYDTYVRYVWHKELRVTVPPPRLGFCVTHRDLHIRNGAKWIREVEGVLRMIFAGRTIIAHGIQNDRIAIGKVLHVAFRVLDTQVIYRKARLCDLVYAHVREDTSNFDWHDPVTDARATMLLYLNRIPYQGRRNFLTICPEQQGDGSTQPGPVDSTQPSPVDSTQRDTWNDNGKDGDEEDDEI